MYVAGNFNKYKILLNNTKQDYVNRFCIAQCVALCTLFSISLSFMTKKEYLHFILVTISVVTPVELFKRFQVQYLYDSIVW